MGCKEQYTPFGLVDEDICCPHLLLMIGCYVRLSCPVEPDLPVFIENSVRKP